MDLDLKILLVEDDAECSLAISEALDQSGHTVTAVRSVVAIKDGILDAVDLSHKPVAVALNDFHLALVDGQLPGAYQGWEVVPMLVAAGVICVGISSSRSSHFKIIDAGAVDLPYGGAMLDWGTVSHWIEQQLLPTGTLYRKLKNRA